MFQCAHKPSDNLPGHTACASRGPRPVDRAASPPPNRTGLQGTTGPGFYAGPGKHDIVGCGSVIIPQISEKPHFSSICVQLDRGSSVRDPKVSSFSMARLSRPAVKCELPLRLPDESHRTTAGKARLSVAMMTRGILYLQPSDMASNSNRCVLHRRVCFCCVAETTTIHRILMI